MEKKESFGRQEIIITKETLHSVMAEIAVQREKKGTSRVLIPYIDKVKKEVEKLGDISSFIQLDQEKFLSAQHMVMEEKSKRLRANPIRAAEGLFIMESTSKNMEKYINHKDLNPVIRARIFRFLGRYADYKGQFNKSENYYRKGLEYFDRSTKPEEKFNRLEFLGFISYSLIKQGKTEDGINLAQKTLKDFDKSDEGRWLKENNYYTWAVWKSGIEIRTAEYIIKNKDSKNTDLAKNFLTDSENILKMPEGRNEAFQLRLDELVVVKNLIT